MQLDTAVTVLRDGGRSKRAGQRVEQRLNDVQDFLSLELEKVEQILEQSCIRGVEPAVSASQHLVELGGKRIRPLSLLLAALCFGKTDHAMLQMASVVELVHSATLLHDDVVDEGMERRGAETARLVHGNGVSVLAGDLLLVTALEMTSVNAPVMLPELLKTLRKLVQGEVIQLRGRTELDLSQSTYYQILNDKTASLFSFAAGCGAQLAGASIEEQQALSSFGEKLGIAFQLIDDVIDYQGDESGKTLFADLIEGKLTLPLVLAIEKEPALAELVARIHAGDESVVEHVSARVIASGACEEVRTRAITLTAEAESVLTTLPLSGAREMLSIVARELTGRVS
jgi:octaprenyl-diphosphate synthase